MLFRIDKEHFLTHMIDHFNTEELENFQYCIISAGIKCGAKVANMAKINEFYPIPEIQELWREKRDKELLKKVYTEMLKEIDFAPIIYRTFIVPLLKHVNVIIICMEVENPYIDVLLEYLKDEFKIDCIDLNKLFITGSSGDFYIDFNEIKNQAVDIARETAKQRYNQLELTRDGRLKILQMMNKKDMKRKVEELGVDTKNVTRDDLNNILMEEWVNDDD